MALALSIAAPIRAEAAPSAGQSISVEVRQEATVHSPRLDGPVNRDNALGLPEWSCGLRAEVEWSLEVGRRLRLGLSPTLSWEQGGGSFDGCSPSSSEAFAEDPAIALDRAEARLSFGEIGLEAIFGKLRPEFGANYIEPLSTTRPRGRGARAAWMGGFFLALGDLGLEAYCEASDDPEAVAVLSALLGSSEAGLAYFRGPGDSLCAWWRGPLGDGTIAYAEAALRGDGGFLDAAGAAPRKIGLNADALAGIGFSPEALPMSVYAEYRFRQAGYSSEDFAVLAAAALPLQGAMLAGFPYLQTARHSIGLHARSEGSGDQGLSWSATCLYLLPDGIYLSAGLEARIVGRLRAGAELSIAAPLSGATPPSSEIPLWPDRWSCSARLTWDLDAREDL
jgi:hypothetical protein